MQLYSRPVFLNRIPSIGHNQEFSTPPTSSLTRPADPPTRPHPLTRWPAQFFLFSVSSIFLANIFCGSEACHKRSYSKQDRRHISIIVHIVCMRACRSICTHGEGNNNVEWSWGWGEDCWAEESKTVLGLRRSRSRFFQIDEGGSYACSSTCVSQRGEGNISLFLSLA